MSFFLKKIVIFLFPIAIIALSSFAFLYYYVNQGRHFIIPQNRHSIILGHSQPACAFDDEIIKNFYNLAQSTEGYPYSYYKAKKVLENNKHIKNIFIEYTNNQIGYWAKERIYGSYMSNNMGRMLPFLDKRFALKVFYTSKNTSEITHSLVNSYRKNMDFLFSKNRSYIENNWHSDKAPNHVFVGDTTVTNQNQKEFVNIFNMQEENIKYLFKLKQLCKQHNVNLFFVRSPNPKYLNERNTTEPFFILIRETYFSEIPFFDFRDYPLSMDNFADNSHVNLQGSKKFSTFFNALINKDLLEKNDYREFIDKEMME